MKNGLIGKTAIVTGASSGIGKALALELARSGTSLSLAARNETALLQIATECSELGVSTLVQPTDVTDRGQCNVLVERTLDRFGAIDFLVLNAGISMWALFEEITELSIFDRIMQVNYIGAINCIHPALPYLRLKRGAIVAVSSAQSRIGMPFHTAYSASKSALQGFLEALDAEVGDDIRVLSILPGWVSGTGLRTNALGGDGNPIGALSRKHNKQAASVAQCAAKIVRAMEGKRRELFIPAYLRWVPWVKLVAPKFLRAMSQRMSGTQK